jgi:hypothetical protein
MAIFGGKGLTGGGVYVLMTVVSQGVDVVEGYFLSISYTIKNKDNTYWGRGIGARLRRLTRGRGRTRRWGLDIISKELRVKDKITGLTGVYTEDVVSSHGVVVG